jgi:hypothetical protein
MAQDLDRSVDRRRRQNARSLASANDARLPQVSEEVLDIRCSDLTERSIAEVLDDGFKPVVDCLANCELLREYVALFVDVRELSERQPSRLRLRTTFLERATANRLLEIIERSLQPRSSL